jgi:ABC-type transporter Mla subunit MlaD
VTRSLSRWQAVVLGLVVVGALGLGGAGLVVIGERAGWAREHFHVTAGFPDVGGVEVGSRVRVQGLDAGEVAAILPPARPGEPVRLKLRIASTYHHLVGRDARVQVVSENLLAGKLVRVLPGAADAPPVEDGGELAAVVEPDLLDGIARAAGKLNKLLAEVDDAMQAFRKQEGSAGSITQELAQATTKLNRVLTRADATLEGIERGRGTLGKLVKDDALYHDLTETLAQAKAALYEVRSGEGTLGKLVKNNEAYSEAMHSLQDVRRMVASVKQNADAIKSLPVVRSYVIDPQRELVRPDCKRSRQWFAAGDLFEPGKAILTDAGKVRLDGAAEWLNGQKAAGSEVVVASFAAPGPNPDYAQTLTQKQSEAVIEYLRGQHQVQRTGFWWWSNRPVRAVGCGTTPSPVPEAEPLPAARVELIVFVPPGS